MKLLLDTQVLIWFQLNDKQLPTKIRLLIEDPANDIFVSYLSFMEITIKQVINRLPDFTVSSDELIRSAESDGLLILPISLAHINAYKLVPFYSDHRDPFDRLILATALAEQMPLVSIDKKFDRYQSIIDVIR